MNHYTLPVWIHDGVGCHKDLAHCSPRGWLDAERTTREIARYAAFVAREFGGEVDLWATENEPFAVVLPGYLLPSANRVNPPGLTLRIAEAKAVMVTLIEAHAAMYDAVKAADLVDADGDGTAASIGLVYATTPTAPKDAASRVDQRGADNVFYLYNTAFLDGVARGLIDADLDGKPDVATPRDDLAHRLDWLGLNYYTKLTVTGTGSASFPTLSALSTFDPTALDLSADDPRGLYEIALWAQGRYGLPMYITETGVDVAGDDTAGASWLVRHLEWAKRAVRDGADLRGFFYWSLIDNYEWNHGMGMKFGLYGVGTDAAKTRTPREAVQAYRDITRARDVPGSWLAKYPAPEP